MLLDEQHATRISQMVMLTNSQQHSSGLVPTTFPCWQEVCYTKVSRCAISLSCRTRQSPRPICSNCCSSHKRWCRRVVSARRRSWKESAESDSRPKNDKWQVLIIPRRVLLLNTILISKGVLAVTIISAEQMNFLKDLFRIWTCRSCQESWKPP